MFIYKLGFDNGVVKTVVHRPSQAVAIVPDDVLIDKEFELVANHSDLGAHVCKGLHHCIDLHKLFDKDQGPNRVKNIHGLSKNFNALAQIASQQSEASLRQARDGHGCAAGRPVPEEAYTSP